VIVLLDKAPAMMAERVVLAKENSVEELRSSELRASQSRRYTILADFEQQNDDNSSPPHETWNNVSPKSSRCSPIRVVICRSKDSPISKPQCP
jgi:hypothetical protein